MQWWRRALTRVPLGLPAAGWMTRFAGLLMTSRSSSSKIEVEGDRLGSQIERFGLGLVDDEVVARCDQGRRFRRVVVDHRP